MGKKNKKVKRSKKEKLVDHLVVVLIHAQWIDKGLRNLWGEKQDTRKHERGAARKRMEVQGWTGGEEKRARGKQQGELKRNSTNILAWHRSIRRTPSERKRENICAARSFLND